MSTTSAMPAPVATRAPRKRSGSGKVILAPAGAESVVVTELDGYQAQCVSDDRLCTGWISRPDYRRRDWAVKAWLRHCHTDHHR